MTTRVAQQVPSRQRWLLPILLALAALSLLLAGCDGSGAEGPPPEPRSFRFSFEEGRQGWEALFTAVFVGREDYFELESGRRRLPRSLDTTRWGLYISGYNHSDGLNMRFKNRVEGLQPGATYEVSFEVAFATKAPSGCLGVGGAPGESVRVTAFASRSEPTRVVEDGDWRLRVEGEPLRLGNVANGISCEEAQRRGSPYQMKRLESKAETASVTADEQGRVWLLVGTSSAFEAATSLYYDEIVAVFEPE